VSHAQVVVVDFEQLSAAPCNFLPDDRVGRAARADSACISAADDLGRRSVLDQCGNSPVNPRSGVKFLAFNSGSTPFTSTGGFPIDPERISFDQRVTQVEIWAASGTHRRSTWTRTTAPCSSDRTRSARSDVGAALRLVASGFTRVVLDTDASVFVYDDLSFTIAGFAPMTPYCFGDGSAPHVRARTLAGRSDDGLPEFTRYRRKVDRRRRRQHRVGFFGAASPRRRPTARSSTSRARRRRTAEAASLRRWIALCVRHRGPVEDDVTAFGTSHIPDSGDPPLSVMGLVVSPGSRTYQAWYRNAASFCTTSTFNLTNGSKIDWAP
jgi:hypothetical protein